MRIIEVGTDIIALIKGTYSFTNLKAIKTALADESQVAHLSNRKVAEAYKIIEQKMTEFTPEEILHEVVDWLL